MPISSLRYVSGSSSSEEELRIWRMSLSAIFETRVEDVDAFRLSMEGWNLGALVLGSIETVAQRYERSRRMVVGGGLDHYLLQLYVSGGFRSVNGGCELEVKPGDIALLDLARPVESQASDARLFNVLMPRGLLDAALPNGAPEGGVVIPGDTMVGGLMRDYLESLARRLPTMRPGESTSIVDATVSLTAASLAPTLASLEQAAVAVDQALLLRVKRFIAQNLDTRRVSPESLCDEFHVSRATLYRLFAPDRGVAAYVRRLRLERCVKALIDPAQAHRSIHDIAEQHGFTCPAHFNRLVRGHYGVPPGQLRERVLQPGGPPEESEALALEEWIRTLGGASPG